MNAFEHSFASDKRSIVSGKWINLIRFPGSFFGLLATRSEFWGTSTFLRYRTVRCSTHTRHNEQEHLNKHFFSVLFDCSLVHSFIYWFSEIIVYENHNEIFISAKQAR